MVSLTLELSQPLSGSTHSATHSSPEVICFFRVLVILVVGVCSLSLENCVKFAKATNTWPLGTLPPVFLGTSGANENDDDEDDEDVGKSLLSASGSHFYFNQNSKSEKRWQAEVLDVTPIKRSFSHEKKRNRKTTTATT